MANLIEQVGGNELQWDLARIQRDPTNLDNSYLGAAQLSPTAVLPAVWSLSWNNGSYPYIWSIKFSTDTAIAWTLYTVFGATALNVNGGMKLGKTSAAAIQILQAQVAAAPAVGNRIGGGYAAAGSYIEVLPGWLNMPFQLSLVLATATVVANCYATWWWAEYAD